MFFFLIIILQFTFKTSDTISLKKCLPMTKLINKARVIKMCLILSNFLLNIEWEVVDVTIQKFRRM